MRIKLIEDFNAGKISSVSEDTTVYVFVDVSIEANTKEIPYYSAIMFIDEETLGVPEAQTIDDLVNKVVRKFEKSSFYKWDGASSVASQLFALANEVNDIHTSSAVS